MENLNLKIFDPNPTSKQKRFDSTANKDRKCHFCDNSNCDYVCPKCDSPYCSVNCFRSQKHLQCSESFYKTMVFQQLKHVKADSEEKDRILEMLKQKASSSDNPSAYMDMISYLEREDDDDEQEELESEWIPNEMMDFVQKILEKTDFIFEENPKVIVNSIWNGLSHQDRNEFIRICDENEALFKRWMPVWTPWWLCSEWQTIVEEVDSPVESKKSGRYPKIYEEIEPLSKLTGKTPDPSLATSIMSVCFAYCYLCRHEDGDISSCAHLADEDQPPLCCDRWMPSIVDALFHLVPSLRPPSSPDETIQSNLTLLESLETLTQRWLMLNDDDDEIKIELDPMANLAERKSALQQLFQDLRIVMEWEQKPGRQLLIQSNPESRKYLAPKAIILILSDLIQILGKIEQCLRHQKTKVTKDKIDNVKMAKQKLKFYLSYAIEYGQERFGGSKQKGFLAAIDFHLEKLRQETIDQKPQNV